jgi:two-component system sensor histidine kinase BarA
MHPDHGFSCERRVGGMTKYGLRARVLAFTILPTLIGGLIAGYFTFHRYQQLENNLIDQGINIIEPLAIASEYGMTQHSRESSSG